VVTLDYAGDSLLVEVRDTGNADPPDSAATSGHGLSGVRDSAATSGQGLSGVGDSAATAGHGLSGMRERAAAAGGTVDIGPLPEGGFRVAARLPLDRPQAPESTEDAQSADSARTALGTERAVR
jgi:signal transduction histidine kinase